jgi:hypothetical protein
MTLTYRSVELRTQCVIGSSDPQQCIRPFLRVSAGRRQPMAARVVHVPVTGFLPSGPAAFLRLFQAFFRLVHHCCCCLKFFVAYLLFFLVIFCSLCFSFLASSLNYPLFCFLTEFLFYLPTTDGWFWFFLSTTDGRDGYPLGFCSVYGMPFSMALVSRFGSLDGLDYLFDSFPTVLQKALSPLYFLLLYVPFPYPTSNRKKKKNYVTKNFQELLIKMLNVVLQQPL